MIKYKYLKSVIVLLFLFAGTIGFEIINEKKADAEQSGWIYSDNSWRYYSGPSIQTGWFNSNGNWYYLDNDGIKKTGWIKSDGKWYYLDTNTGRMLTGWIEDKGKWYYLNNCGEMVTGWIKYNGNLYYLNTSGFMVRDIYIGEYYLGPDGAWREGSCNNRQ